VTTIAASNGNVALGSPQGVDRILTAFSAFSATEIKAGEKSADLHWSDLIAVVS